VWQTIRQAKQRTESTIRTEVSLLHNERQRLESDITQIDIELSKEEHKNKGEIEKLRGRRRVLSKRIKEVSGYYSYMLKKYKDILPDLTFFTLPDELKDRCLEEYVQCLDKARENQKKAPS
jgi:chromosome segregation ATPase